MIQEGKKQPKSVKVRRGRREGDGTENVMTERPSHAHWFVLRAHDLPNQFLPLFFASEDIHGRGGGGASDKMGLDGAGDRFVMTFSDVFLPVPFLVSPFVTFSN